MEVHLALQSHLTRKDIKMKIKTIFTILPILATIVLSSPIDKLTFVTEEYPPFNYTKDGKLLGENTQIIENILKIANSNQKVENILVLPWAIGYEMALTTPNTALFSTTKTTQRVPLFEWVGPLASHKTVLLAKKSLSGQKLQDISSLKVVVIHKDAGAQLLENLPTKPKQIITASTNIEAAQMLHYGRVDAWAYGELTGEWILEMIGLNPNDYTSILTLATSDLYIALHPDSDPKAILELKKAFEEIHLARPKKEDGL